MTVHRRNVALNSLACSLSMISAFVGLLLNFLSTRRCGIYLIPSIVVLNTINFQFYIGSPVDSRP